MTELLFDGQQGDEQVLYEITPQALTMYVKIITIVLLAVFFYVFLLLISTVAPSFASILRVVGFVLSIVLIIGGVWWNKTVYKKSRAYITDRRIMRIEVMTPFITTKRALFWNEALKAKGYSPNLLYRWLNIGTIEIDPIVSGQENVRITDVYYFEDLANYIDKILFTFKNKPTEVTTLKPFVPKPKGQRG